MDNLLNNLRIDSFYKLMIYLSGVILIASLFLPVKYLNQDSIFKLSLKFLMLGASYWIIDNCFYRFSGFAKDEGLRDFLVVLYFLIFYISPFVIGSIWLIPLFK